MKKVILISVAAVAAIAAILHFGNAYKSGRAAQSEEASTTAYQTTAPAALTATGLRSDAGVSLTGITFDGSVFIVDIKNDSGGFINFGNEYSLERLDGEKIKPNGAYSFSTGGNVVDNGFATDQVYDLAAYFGGLAAGEYRFTATVYLSLDSSRSNAAYPSITFSVG